MYRTLLLITLVLFIFSGCSKHREIKQTANQYLKSIIDGEYEVAYSSLIPGEKALITLEEYKEKHSGKLPPHWVAENKSYSLNIVNVNTFNKWHAQLGKETVFSFVRLEFWVPKKSVFREFYDIQEYREVELVKANGQWYIYEDILHYINVRDYKKKNKSLLEDELELE